MMKLHNATSVSILYYIYIYIYIYYILIEKIISILIDWLIYPVHGIVWTRNCRLGSSRDLLWGSSTFEVHVEILADIINTSIRLNRLNRLNLHLGSLQLRALDWGWLGTNWTRHARTLCFGNTFASCSTRTLGHIHLGLWWRANLWHNSGWCPCWCSDRLCHCSTLLPTMGFKTVHSEIGQSKLQKLGASNCSFKLIVKGPSLIPNRCSSFCNTSSVWKESTEEDDRAWAVEWAGYQTGSGGYKDLFSSRGTKDGPRVLAAVGGFGTITWYSNFISISQNISKKINAN